MSMAENEERADFIALQKNWILAVAQLKSVLDKTERSLRFARMCNHHIERHGHISPEDLDRLSRQFLSSPGEARAASNHHES